MENIVSEKYLKIVKNFDELFKNAVKISQKNEGIPDLPYYKVFASVVFTTIATRSATLTSVTPYSSFNKNPTHWDYASIGGIVRSILENRLTFYYMCIENIEPSERMARWKMFQLHDCCSRQKLFSHFPEDNKNDIEGFEGQKLELINQIEKNTFFSSLTPKEQKNFLKGKNAFLVPLEDIAVKVDIELNEFRIFYQILSSFNHSLPMSLLRMGEQVRGRGVHSRTEESYIMMFIELASKMLKDSTDEYIKLFNKP